jgi:hypothetical protein
MVHQLVDKATALALLQVLAPELKDFLQVVRDNRGRVAWQEKFAEFVDRLNIGGYPKLYESEPAAGTLLAMAFCGGLQQAKVFNDYLAILSPAERGAGLLQLGPQLYELIDSLDFDPPPEKKVALERASQSLSDGERQEGVHFLQSLFMGILALLHQMQSVMVHGERLTALVAQAKAGDDKAFLKAIQIDKRILTEVDYFKQRWARAYARGEIALIKSAARMLEAPSFVGRIQHKTVMLSLFLLDWLGLLESYSDDELLDTLIASGMVDEDQPIDDVKNLSKIRRRYRQLKAKAGLSTP